MAKAKRTEKVEGLRLSLNNQEIGVLTHYSGGKNIIVFSPEYIALPETKRKVFTLSQLANSQYLSGPLISAQRLPPVLSNLLPEGALRNWMTQSLKLHIDNEFALMAHMGRNLPGALQASPIAAGSVPQWALDHRKQITAVQIDVNQSQDKFSLAGVQMKFSSVQNEDGRFTIGRDDNDDSWIIKTPSTLHRYVPYNEYSAMMLAEAVGVDIPVIKLVKLTQLSGLPDIQLPDEDHAYAIRRFDRSENHRIHTEDFAQIFQVYAHQKYQQFNYEQIANTLFNYSSQGLKDVQQMARRLLVNVLLANGDAHLKNWSLMYQDGRRPELSPAYDIVSTLPYVEGEQEFALNMAKNKNWYKTDLASFEIWAKRVGLPWQAIKIHLQDVMELARANWPGMLKHLPMHEKHQQALKGHWKNLTCDFRIDAG